MEKLSLEQLKERYKDGTLAGVFLVDIEDYHAGPGLSSTDIKKIAKSPAAWKRGKEAGTKLSSTALEFGSLYHTIALEYQEFEKRYAVTQLSRKGSKKWDLEESAATEEGKKLVKQSDIDTIHAMFARIVGDEAKGVTPHSKRKLLLGQKECSFYWTDSETGLLCKTRPDVLTEKGHAVDLKTTRCKDDKQLQNDTYSFGYHISAAMQLVGVKEATEQAKCQADVVAVPTNFLFFFQGKTAPFPIFVRHLDPQALELGQSVLHQALRKFKEIEDSNSWEAVKEQLAKDEISKLEEDSAPQDETITMIGVPSWAYTEVRGE